MIFEQVYPRVCRFLLLPLPEPHWCTSPLFFNQNVGFCIQSGNSQGTKLVQNYAKV